MGSFAGHLLPGTLFLLIGLWHIATSIFQFVSSPRSFRICVWRPLPFRRLKYIELYIITIGSLLDMCLELFYSTHLRFTVNGALNSAHMNDFEHAAMLLMFFLFGFIALLSETTGLLPLPNGALFVIASMAFTAEYLLFNFHSTSHAGLEGRYHAILVLLIGLCIVFSLLSALFSNSFVVDLMSGMLITSQGLWFYQIAFTLYGPWMPRGCHKLPEGPSCESADFELRGQSLADVQLTMIVMSLLLVVITFYASMAKLCGHHEDLASLASTGYKKDLHPQCGPL